MSMPVPADLPQPVRLHPAHQLPLSGTGWASPGPAAYEGYGVTVFDRDHRGGRFLGGSPMAMSASDRGRGGQGSEHRAGSPHSETRAGAGSTATATGSATPGPIYDQRLPPPPAKCTSMPRAQRFKSEKQMRDAGGPGPGAYYGGYDEGGGPGASTIERKKESSSNSGSFPKARRMPAERGGTRDTPSSAEYDPAAGAAALSQRVNHPAASFPHSASMAVRRCATTEVLMAGPDELSRAEQWTRPGRNRGVSIPRSHRWGAGAGAPRPGSADIGPGQYDVVSAKSKLALARASPQVGFTQGARRFTHLTDAMDPEIAAVGGGPGPVMLPSTLAKRGVRLSPQRNGGGGGGGGKNDSTGGLLPRHPQDENGPGLYNPDVTQTKPSSAAPSFTRAQRFGGGASRSGSKGGAGAGGGGGGGAEDVTLPSTLDTQHGASIGHAKRFRMSDEQREWFSHPSAAEYTPQLSKRPESASRSILGRNDKTGQLLREARQTPGPKYASVDMNLTRTPQARPVSFSRARRGLVDGTNRGNGVPGAGAYDATLPKRSSRSAILYLGG